MENMNFRDQKYMFDHFASLGINHRSVHGMFYSLRGRGKRAYPPHVLDYQPYWEKYGYLADTVVVMYLTSMAFRADMTDFQ